jgi:hypothetical protein
MGYYVLRVLISPRSSKRARADLQVRRRTTLSIRSNWYRWACATLRQGPTSRGRTRRDSRGSDTPPELKPARRVGPRTAPNRAVRVGIGRGPPHDPKPPFRGELLTARLTVRAL